jgi:hypothetical protein
MRVVPPFDEVEDAKAGLLRVATPLGGSPHVDSNEKIRKYDVFRSC